MAEPSEHLQSCPRCRVLERRIAELEAELAERDARIAKLEGRIAELERMLLETTRASKRQAAPFSRNQPKVKPKKPGRRGAWVRQPPYRPPANRAS